MDHRYVVRFARDDPEMPPTKAEQIALGREAARKLGIPNCEGEPLYRIGRNSNTGEGLGIRRVVVGGASVARDRVSI